MLRRCAVRLIGPLGGPPSPADPRGSALGLADAFAVLRLLVSPASLPALAVAAWACIHPPSTRRLRWAAALELAGVLAAVAFLG
jgi:hypothetical protein